MSINILIVVAAASTLLNAGAFYWLHAKVKSLRLATRHALQTETEQRKADLKQHQDGAEVVRQFQKHEVDKNTKALEEIVSSHKLLDRKVHDYITRAVVKKSLLSAK